MSKTELILPKMGESVAEATIIKWLKSEGDSIEIDESIVEIATDKVDSEIPSPVSGTLLNIVSQEGETVSVGSVIAWIGDSGTEIEVTPAKEMSFSEEKEPILPKEISNGTSNNQVETTISDSETISIDTASGNKNLPPRFGNGKFYSPLVRRIAQKEGVSINELTIIEGNGKKGRVTKTDLMAYLKEKESRESNVLPPSAPIQNIASTEIDTAKPIISNPPISSNTTSPISSGDEIIEMDRMRKLISEHMVSSKHTSPHVTSFVEADVTNVVLWRNKIKSNFETKEGEKFTFTPIFIDAVARAIRDFPMINVSVDGTNIVKKKNINIGMAAALPSGNLIVPVIKNADRMNLYGMAKSVNDLANRARLNKLGPDEIQGGTFTITNVGTFGNLMGTPIINQPQVAILATGAIKKKPVVIENPEGDSIGIRHMMYLSLSYDHRVVDGALGGSFLRKVAEYLEEFDINQNI